MSTAYFFHIDTRTYFGGIKSDSPTCKLSGTPKYATLLSEEPINLHFQTPKI